MFMSPQEGGARRQPLVLGSTSSILLHPLSSAHTLPFKSVFPSHPESVSWVKQQDGGQSLAASMRVRLYSSS